MGSGTTAKIAHLLKRKWIGSEISKEYVEISEERLKEHTMNNLFTTI
jgi:site-specific DNA-methyltransferase (adenine-specific)